LYFPPDNATDMAAAILAAIDQTADLTQRGLVASASFSWQEVARLHDDVYAELE
jgi:hypothetical protein